MKVLILVMVLALPNGEMTSSMTQVATCPPREEVVQMIDKLKTEGAITNAVVVCKSVDITMRDA